MLEFQIEAGNHVRRRPGRRHQCKPRRRFEIGKGGFGNCGKLRRRGRAPGAGDGECAQLSGFHIAQDGGEIGEHERNLAAQKIVDGRRFSAIGDVRHLDAGER